MNWLMASSVKNVEEECVVENLGNPKEKRRLTHLFVLRIEKQQKKTSMLCNHCPRGVEDHTIDQNNTIDNTIARGSSQYSSARRTAPGDCLTILQMC